MFVFLWPVCPHWYNYPWVSYCTVCPVWSSDKTELLSSWLDRQTAWVTDKAHQDSVRVTTQRIWIDSDALPLTKFRTRISFWQLVAWLMTKLQTGLCTPLFVGLTHCVCQRRCLSLTERRPKGHRCILFLTVKNNCTHIQNSVLSPSLESSHPATFTF